MKVHELIAKAAEKLGSEYKVAKAMEITPQRLSNWKNERDTCSPEDRALLADIAGVDPFPEIAQALIERCAGKPKGDVLRRVLAYGKTTSFSYVQSALSNLFFSKARAFSHLLTVDGLAPTARAAAL